MKRIKRTTILLGVILFFGFLVRFYGFSNPIADWHSWRQSETSSVSRNFVKDGFDLLHPRMDNISNVQSGMDNPQGYFFVEFPLYNATQAALFQLIGIFTIEEWGRLVSIFASTIAGLFLYLLVSKHSNTKIGLLAAFFYAFIPYNIYYGRTILAESSMVMAILGGIYFFDRWLEERLRFKNRHSGKRVPSASRIDVKDSGQARMTNKSYLFYFLAILFTASAFLLKPFAIFFVLPLVYLAGKHFGWRLFLAWQLWLFMIITIAPLASWRLWMTQFPEGIPANAWLMNGNGIRFRPAFFRWILYERFTILISGYFGIVFALFGLYQLRKIKEWLFFVSFFVSSIIYVTVFATGNVQHDYYQILVMPSIAMLFAFGAYALSLIKIKKLPVGLLLVGICVIGGFYFGWDRVKDYYNINNRSIVAAGEAVQRLTAPDAKVIANYTGDSSFLYQTNRKGWASFQDPLPIMIEKGAHYLILVNPTENDMVFGETYKVVERTKEYVIFDLRSTN